MVWRCEDSEISNVTKHTRPFLILVVPTTPTYIVCTLPIFVFSHNLLLPNSPDDFFSIKRLMLSSNNRSYFVDAPPDTSSTSFQSSNSDHHQNRRDTSSWESRARCLTGQILEDPNLSSYPVQWPIKHPVVWPSRAMIGS